MIRHSRAFPSDASIASIVPSLPSLNDHDDDDAVPGGMEQERVPPT